MHFITYCYVLSLVACGVNPEVAVQNLKENPSDHRDARPRGSVFQGEAGSGVEEAASFLQGQEC